MFPCGRIVSVGTVTKVSKEIRAGYDAPFPDKSFQAGARAFPQLVPTSADDPGAAGRPHDRINGGHFVQEDCGPELAARMLSWDPVRG